MTLQKFNVYILSVLKPLPTPGSGDQEFSAHSQQILRPLSLLRQVARYVSPGEEFVTDDLYCREWAVLIAPGLIETVKLNPSIFTLRRVYAPEFFPGKYTDLLVGPGYLREFPMGTIADPDS